MRQLVERDCVIIDHNFSDQMRSNLAVAARTFDPTIGTTAIAGPNVATHSNVIPDYNDIR